MKNTLTIATLFLAACTSDKTDNNVQTPPTKDNNVVIPKRQTTKDDLIGEWGIYATSNDSVVTLCNVCPTVTFSENGTATINYSGRLFGDKIKWKREKQTLTIENVTINDNTGEFVDGKYTLTFDKDELEMRELGTRYSHTLRKHDVSNWR
jgi:hypothetical protein